MSAEVDRRKAKWFIASLAVVALFINTLFLKPITREVPDYTQRAWQPEPTYSPPSELERASRSPQPSAPRPETPEEKEAREREAAKRAAEQHAAMLARYLTPGTYQRVSGAQNVAIVAVSDSGNLNRNLATALADRVRANGVKILSSLFTPEFVSDGLFARLCNGDRDVLHALELPKFLDAIVLARQQTGYVTQTALENVITANMNLEMIILPVSAPNDPYTLSFTANGAGFKESAARLMAEERLLKQLSKDAKLSLSRVLDLQAP